MAAASPPHPLDAETIARREAVFGDEARRFRLRYRCHDCAHVIASTRACSLGYPNVVLRDLPGAFQPNGEVGFCKYFEAGR